MISHFVRDDANWFEVIIRQLGERTLTFYFPQHCKAFQISKLHGQFFLDMIKPDTALYLVEPLTSLKEPEPTGMKTIITCPPDRRRYHKFLKRGAVKYYMPVWSCDELLSVGAHVRAHIVDKQLKELLAPEKIEK